jgi:hypothetical protein
MVKYLRISHLETPSSHMTLYPIPSEFFIDEENFLYFFISVLSFQLTMKYSKTKYNDFTISGALHFPFYPLFSQGHTFKGDIFGNFCYFLAHHDWRKR